MLLPPGGLFSDSLLVDLDLQRLSEYYNSNPSLLQRPTQPQPQPQNNPLMDIVREPELLEQDLLPFPPSVLSALSSLPPGKLPGVPAVTAVTAFPVPFAAEAQSGSAATVGTKQPPSSLLDSPTKKRLKTEQNVTIQHF